ncbi:Fic family protein [Aminobacter sp. MSH1]|uniref:Fic family protein n=1 Tax=Aminobacter sp. MSH1 TaxID=374606 RepID=UPI000D341BF5|nr:Fic family protein [Aminobacter sp. MSH1]
MTAETERTELRERLEAFYTSKRLTELYLSPVGGKFDAAHLREINRRIFQDLPSAGFPDVTPGQYRKAAPRGGDWIKDRRLEGLNMVTHVAYSPMDKAAVARLDDVLGAIDVGKLSKMKTAPFVRAIGKLYAELDYIHPFPDGNSRTLREFTRELGEASGFSIDWTRFARNPQGRNVLYVARDLSVNAIALPELRSDKTKRLVTFTMDRLAGNRELPDLLRDAIIPGRAIGFRKLRETEAVRTFPELKPAFEAMRKAEAYGMAKFPDDPQQRREFVDAVRSTIVERLDAGETKDFRPKVTKRDDPATRERAPPDKERER